MLNRPTISSRWFLYFFNCSFETTMFLKNSGCWLNTVLFDLCTLKTGATACSSPWGFISPLSKILDQNGNYLVATAADGNQTTESWACGTPVFTKKQPSSQQQANALTGGTSSTITGSPITAPTASLTNASTNAIQGVPLGFPNSEVDIIMGANPSDIINIKAQRKKDGVCIECGDKGQIKAMACFCPIHGKIWG